MCEQDFARRASDVKEELVKVLELIQRMFDEDNAFKADNFQMLQSQLQLILLNYQNAYDMEAQEDFQQTI